MFKFQMSHNNKLTGRALPFALIVVLLAVFAFVLGAFIYNFTPKEVNLNSLQHATSFHTSPRKFPEFSLLNHHGKKVTNETIKDSWNFVFFGFTHCPDVCPLTLTVLDQVISKLNEENTNNSRAILVSVDPRRDTTKKLHEYVKHFNDYTLGLTGETEEIKQLTQKLGVVYTTPDSSQGENYLVDHSAHIFLVAPNGYLSALFSTPHDAATIIKDFKLLNAYHEQKKS